MRRREALAAAAGLFGMAPATAKAALEVPPLPDDKLFARDPEGYWLRVRREQFLLPEGRAFLNVGSLGVAAKPALAATFSYLTQSASLEGLTSDGLPRWGGEPSTTGARSWPISSDARKTSWRSHATPPTA